jgi:hypothetical protein
MKGTAAAPWQRLAPLALLVLVAHLAVLVGPLQVRPAQKQSLHFRTRAITAAPSAPPPAQAAPAVAQQPPPPRETPQLRPQLQRRLRPRTPSPCPVRPACATKSR